MPKLYGARLIFSRAIVPTKSINAQPGRYSASARIKIAKKTKSPVRIGKTPRLLNKIKKQTKKILVKTK